MSISSAPNKDITSSFLSLAVTGEAGLLLLAWALAEWLDVSPLEYLRPSFEGLVWGTVATLPLLLALSWMLRTESSPIRRLVALVVDQMGPLLAHRTKLELGLLAAVAGVSEEILFRGVVQVGLTRWVSGGSALLVASILFGLVHFASRAYAVLAGIMGLYLGLIFLSQGSLMAPIVTHGLYDFFALRSVVRLYRERRPTAAAQPETMDG